MLAQSMNGANPQPPGEVLTNFNALEQRFGKVNQDEPHNAVRQLSNGDAAHKSGSKSEMDELRNRVRLLEINMAGLKDTFLKHNESVLPTVEKEIVHLTHVMEEREYVIKTEMAQFTEQVADASAEREKRIKDEMAQITDQVANATASMIERILGDMVSLTERLQKVEYLQDIASTDRALLRPTAESAFAHANGLMNGGWTNGNYSHEAEPIIRSQASLDSSTRGSGMSQSVGQGSSGAFHEFHEQRPRSQSVSRRIPGHHISENLNQSLHHLTHAVDRMVNVGNRAPSVEKTSESVNRMIAMSNSMDNGSEGLYEGAGTPASSTNFAMTPAPPKLPVDSPRQTIIRTERKPDSSPGRGYAQPMVSSVPPASSVPPPNGGRAASPVNNRGRSTVTPRTASRDDAFFRGQQVGRGSHTVPVHVRSPQSASRPPPIVKPKEVPVPIVTQAVYQPKKSFTTM